MTDWDVTPGAVAPASVDVTVRERMTMTSPWSGVSSTFPVATTITLTEDDALALAEAIRTELDKSRDLLHPGHGDTDPTERAS